MSTYLDEDALPSPEQQFAELLEYSPESPDWVAEKISASELYSQLSNAQRIELIGYLTTGLVRSFSSHAFVQFRLNQDKCFAGVEELIKWVSQWRFSGGGEAAFHGCYQLPKTFWGHPHHENSAWTGSVTIPFCEGFMADWSIGKFGAIYDRHNLSHHLEEPLETVAIGQLVCFAVAFQKSDIEATFGRLPGPKVVRNSTYDWEAAFADVAAQLYRDIDFPDINARGVQSELIGLLRDSFESRKLPVPADDTLKPKAKKLLGALRSKKPEKP